MYSITDLKTKKRVKNVQTKKLKGFLPASKNKTKTTYKVVLAALDSKGRKMASRITFFHVEDFVVQPTGSFNYAP